MKKNKALYIRSYWCDSLTGGSISHTSGVINSLNKKTNLTVVTNQKIIGIDYSKTKVITIPQKKRALIPMHIQTYFYNIKMYKKLIKLIDIKSYNWFYYRYWGANIIALLLMKIKNIPLVLEFNSSEVWIAKHWHNKKNLISYLIKRTYNLLYIPFLKRIEIKLFKKASLIVVVSKALKEFLLQEGVPENKILVNPNGVDSDKFSPEIDGSNIRNQYKLQNKFIVGFIGSFAQWHGVVELAKAIKLFNIKYSDHKNTLQFLLIGNGLLMPEVKNLLKNENNVIITGEVPQAKSPEYLAACDILLSPHIPNPDGSKFFGSPTKLFEYMAMGKPIIASNLDQIGDILEHNKTGFLIPPGNMEKLAEAIYLVIQDKYLQQKLGQNARNKVLEKYTWDRNVSNFLDKIQI